MNDENDDGVSALDHIFNAFGFLAKAQRKQAQAQAESGGKKPKRIKAGATGKAAKSFDDAPAAGSRGGDASCCTAKRE